MNNYTPWDNVDPQKLAGLVQPVPLPPANTPVLTPPPPPEPAPGAQPPAPTAPTPAMPPSTATPPGSTQPAITSRIPTVPVSPAGRTYDEILNSPTYASDAERAWFKTQLPLQRRGARPVTSDATSIPIASNFNFPTSGSNPPGSVRLPEPTTAGIQVPVVHAGVHPPVQLDPHTVSSIQQAFDPREWQTAYLVVAAESGGNHAATGRAGEVGDFQINPGPIDPATGQPAFWQGYSRALGIPVNAVTLQDPQVNARVAAYIWRTQGGWARDGNPYPWSTAPEILRYLGR